MQKSKPNLIRRRKFLRTHLTPAEVELWKYLKGEQVCNLKFRRQHSIDNYILDFYCPKIKLAIELDGECHIYNEEYDSKRDEVIRSKGIEIFRYENLMVFEHPDVILNDIDEYCKSFDLEVDCKNK